MDSSVHRLPALKLKLTTDTDLGSIFDYFFDHFGENDDFIAASKPRYNSTLREILGYTIGIMLRKSGAQRAEVSMLTVPKQQFYHGTIKTSDYLAPFFYFEDIDMGIVAVAEGDNTLFARFRVQQVSPPPAPPKN